MVFFLVVICCYFLGWEPHPAVLRQDSRRAGIFWAVGNGTQVRPPGAKQLKHGPRLSAPTSLLLLFVVLFSLFWGEDGKATMKEKLCREETASANRGGCLRFGRLITPSATDRARAAEGVRGWGGRGQRRLGIEPTAAAPCLRVRPSANGLASVGE